MTETEIKIKIHELLELTEKTRDIADTLIADMKTSCQPYDAITLINDIAHNNCPTNNETYILSMLTSTGYIETNVSFSNIKHSVNPMLLAWLNKEITTKSNRIGIRCYTANEEKELFTYLTALGYKWNGRTLSDDNCIISSGDISHTNGIVYFLNESHDITWSNNVKIKSAFNFKDLLRDFSQT